MSDDVTADWLPGLVDFDWNAYEASLEGAYRIFVRDFGSESARGRFRDKRMQLKRYPEYDGKSATFWHFVTEGPIEESRYPVRERVQRIAWPKAMINEAEANSGRVRIWQNTRRRSGHGKGTRWIIALTDFSYVVVLEERQTYVLPWTAYPVERNHQRVKLRKEWVEWEQAQKN